MAIGAVLVYFGIDLLRQRERPARRSDAAGEQLDIRAAVLTGLGVGLLGGLVGLILGALRMPALLRYVGETPARAVGTNLAVGVCVGIAGVIGHTPDGVDWDLLAIGSAASVPGALLGARLTGRLSERQLLRAIGAMLVVAGAATALQACGLLQRPPATRRKPLQNRGIERAPNVAVQSESPEWDSTGDDRRSTTRWPAR